MNGSCAYFHRPGVSSHALIEIARTPLHCWAKYVNPARPNQEPTAAMQFGTLVHTLALTPETFNEEFVRADAINRRTAEGKAHYAALLESGQHIVTAKDYQAAIQIVKALRSHPVAGGLFKVGEPEKVLIVPRESPLLPLKGRLDWLSPQPAIVELKTAADASKVAFLHTVYRYGYHLSAAYYRTLVSRVTGAPESAIPHTFVVVEPKPPYAVAVYPTAEGLLAEGREAWEANLARFDECWINQDWPSYPVESLKPSSGMNRGLRFAIEEGELEL